MAFYTSLSIIPALFLITYIVSSILGSSREALLKIQELLAQFIPQYSDVIIKEVKKVGAFKRGIGIINIILFIWSTLPLSSSIRTALRTIFRIETRKPFLMEKIFDALIMGIFIISLSVVAIKDPVIEFLTQRVPFFTVPFYMESFVSGIVIFLLLVFLYGAFTFKGWRHKKDVNISAEGPDFLKVLFGITQITTEFRARSRYLAAGALTATILWFCLKPLFNLMLSYNPGYGLTFGSFKSLFVIIIWIYYSQIIFLFGAEVSSALERKEVLFLKEAIVSGKEIPRKIRQRYVITFKAGEIIFNEGDHGDKMFYILKGTVAIEKQGEVVAIIEEGKYFGEISFLLSMPRSAGARAMEYTELLMIDYKNIDMLTREMPDLMYEILKEMARRLKETTQRAL